MEVPQSNGNFSEEVVKIWQFVAVNVSGGFKSLESSDSMLGNDSDTADNSVVVFLFEGQWSVLGRLQWHDGIVMLFLHSLKAGISPGGHVFWYVREHAFLVSDPFVMPSARLCVRHVVIPSLNNVSALL